MIAMPPPPNPAEWSAHTRIMIPEMAVAESIRRRLADFDSIAAVGGRAAAVVICVIDDPDGPHVLMIKRAYRGMNGGQWAFPGGKIEPGERPVQAALRELHEEIGLALDESDVVGRLDDFVTDSGFVISPFVAITAPAPLHPNPDEVHSVHRIPLTRLIQDDVPHWITTAEGAEMLQLRLAPNWTVHAPTGAILYQFREVALLGRPTRVADLLQPRFTRE
jgi:8-oxo-dGTP pyrophosphatase MutT (NUDIX family)